MAKRDGKPTREVVARDPDGTVFYRENPPTDSPMIAVPLGQIDWLLLSRQKLALLKLTWEDDDHILAGLVDLIDRIQDEGDRQGQPVVWFSDEFDEGEPEPENQS